MVPAILYGLKEPALQIQVPGEELELALRRRARMLELDLNQKKDLVLLKAVQYDSFGDDIIHADFMRVAMDAMLRLEVPVQLKGQPKIEHAVLQQTLANVEIECLPRDIPQSILAPVADLQVGQTLHVSELILPPGVKILTDPGVIVATITELLEEEVAPAAAAVVGEATGVEPEVIGRKAKEEGEEEEEEKK